MEIFIKVNTLNEVIEQHYMPFDAKNGKHKTREELLSEGYLIDQNKIPPEPHVLSDKRNVLMYENDVFSWITEETESDQTKKIKELEEKNLQLETQLTDTQLALAEFYETMLGGQA